MTTHKYERRGVMPLIASLLLLTACSKREEPPPDHPRLTARVNMRDVIFHSVALNRDMPYRVVFPASIPAGEKLPVVYLLHGGGGGFRDWTNYSDVARFAEQGLILVMPEGNSSYYVNSAERPQDRYEDYIVKDLISDVEARFPADSSRSNRAIIGISMGGFGAVNLSFKHADLFVFAGAMSPAIDVRVDPSPLSGLGNGANTAQFLDHGEAKPGTITIPMYSQSWFIPHKCHTYFCHAGNRKAYSRQTGDSQASLQNIIFNMSSTPAPEVTTGINGIDVCQRSFKVSSNT